MAKGLRAMFYASLFLKKIVPRASEKVKTEKYEAAGPRRCAGKK